MSSSNLDTDSPVVQALLEHSDSLDASNDLGYLLGLISEALQDSESFESDFDRAGWVIAQWSQELRYQPDISNYGVGKTIPIGRMEPNQLSHRTTPSEEATDG